MPYHIFLNNRSWGLRRIVLFVPAGQVSQKCEYPLQTVYENTSKVEVKGVLPLWWRVGVTLKSAAEINPVTGKKEFLQRIKLTFFPVSPGNIFYAFSLSLLPQFW
jgi:hypothetical protein